MLLITALLIACGVLLFYDFAWLEKELRTGFLYGVQLGGCSSLAAVCLATLIRYRRILRDEQALKAAYYREHDERSQAIRAKAGAPMILVTSVLMIVAGMVASYFNPIIFYSLFLAALCQLVAALVVKIIYTRLL